MNESILVQELDRELTDDQPRESLRSLHIINTPLIQILTSVCKLVNLTSLNLDHNRLTRLPDNCFTRMRELQSLTARNNYITELQDGLFDGLNCLRELKFDNNQISSIGLHVFSNHSDLVNLNDISLRYNRLQSLEPWPYIRGFYGSQDSRVVVELEHNQISNFTNHVYWRFNCTTLSYASVHLWSNNIRHFNDILLGWNVTTSSQFLCLFRCKMEHPSFRILMDSSRDYVCDCQDFFLHTFLAEFVQRDTQKELVRSARSVL